MTPQAVIRAVRFPLATVLLTLGIGAASAQKVELDVPYVPTPPGVVEKMLDLTAVKNGDKVIDLGSGDGRIAIAAAKRGAEAYGVDIDPVRVKEAIENAKQEGVAERATFEEKDLFDTNISDFDVVTMYLLPSINRDLRPRLLELKPGTRITSHAFDMGEWEPDERAVVNGRNVYFWRVPANVDGRWVFQHNGSRLEVTLNQNFQKLSGTALIDGTQAPVTGDVTGDVIRLALGEGETRREFTGRVNGEGLEPVAVGGSVSDWSARRG